MSEEGNLLADLIAVATEELDNLNKKRPSLQETDIFKNESNLPEKKSKDNSSYIHKGDTDSSDDEENRTCEKTYNACGMEIKHLLQNTASPYHRTEEQPRASSWKPKVSFAPPSSSKSTPTTSITANKKTHDVFIDPIFGMRIVNPLISSTTLKELIVDREVVPFVKISRYIQMCEKDKDWVISGVIASKSAVKTSQKGSQFCIWTLSDLKCDVKTVSLFLFSRAHKELWKTPVGTVVGVLNPNILDKRDGSKDEACLSIDNAQKVLILGISKDFGTCKSIKKNGEVCNAIVNLNQCEYCIYHIKQEYQKCSKRSELQANFAGRGLLALRNKVLGKNEVFYAGKSYMAIPAKKSKKLEFRDNSRLQSLNGQGLSTIPTSKTKHNPTSKKKNAVGLDVSQAQRLRDMELLKKLGGCGGLETKNYFSGHHSTNLSLKDSKEIALNVIDKLKSKNKSYNIETASALESNNESIQSDNYVNISSVNDERNKLNNANTTNSQLSSKYAEIKANNKSLPFPFEKTQFPILSSEFNTFVDLNKPVTVKQMDSAKLNALKYVQFTGGIKKVDPNSTRGSGKKRGMEEVEKTESTPKKSKLIETDFVKSDRFKKIMEATSKHLDLLESRDNDEKEKYFNKMEIKEKMEEKMINTHKVACKAVRCLKCKYTSFSASDMCKSEKHPLKVFDATKRFFKCGDCSNRTVTLEIIPIEPCKNCGGGKWQKSGMMKEKCFTSHSLSIRGGEQKFVNSITTDSNINLLVPDMQS